MTTVLHYGILKLVTARYKIGHKQLRPKTKKSRVLNAQFFPIVKHFSGLLFELRVVGVLPCLTENRLLSLISVLFDQTC